MRAGQRFGLSAIEKRDVWSRWKAGQSLHEIGRAFDKPHSCIRSVLVPRGGIPPACSSPFAAGAHASGAGGHLPKESLPIRRFVRIARRLDRAGLHREPGDFSPWWPSGLSRP